ncbi:hypothetical protein EVAR_14647_1 [Eumeta japonica]|uniref:Uncharacterized protein n=1 Tax=Eumeta variegata TaxID=151549 RepID=A0A4C1U2B7_EUMVA|nr:hypothetical protein EVAR_14647_1 [Eumeta japonica]
MEIYRLRRRGGPSLRPRAARLEGPSRRGKKLTKQRHANRDPDEAAFGITAPLFMAAPPAPGQERSARAQARARAPARAPLLRRHQQLSRNVYTTCACGFEMCMHTLLDFRSLGNTRGISKIATRRLKLRLPCARGGRRSEFREVWNSTRLPERRPAAARGVSLDKVNQKRSTNTALYYRCGRYTNGSSARVARGPLMAAAGKSPATGSARAAGDGTCGAYPRDVKYREEYYI